MASTAMFLDCWANSSTSDEKLSNGVASLFSSFMTTMENKEEAIIEETRQKTL